MRKGEMLSYRYTVEKAREAGDTEALKSLEEIGSPPYEGGQPSLTTQRRLLARYGGTFRTISYADFMGFIQTSPHYSDSDRETMMGAFSWSMAHLWPEAMRVSFPEDIRRVAVPVLFFAGRFDFQTPCELLEPYVSTLDAPYKKIIWFGQSGHMPKLEEPERFQEELINGLLDLF